MQYIVVVMFLMIFSISILPAFSQTEQEATACDVTEDLICVETAKGFYQEGETIVISGKVKAVILDTPVSLQVFFGETLIQIDQVEVAQDGSYTATLLAEGKLWDKDGTYLVRSAYSGNIAETTFEFEAAENDVVENDFWEVDAGTSGTFDVEYSINGGSIQSIQIKPEILGLVVTIDSPRNGIITLDLPRDSIDAKKSDGTDERFLIFIDGAEVQYTENANSSSRKISFEFKQGDSQIEIIGTFVVPEFGAVAALILAVAIISIVAVTARSRLSIMPKY